MMYDEKAKEARLRRLKIYWDSVVPKMNVYAGEIYEIDFGINPNGEFSGRHLALCLKDSMSGFDKILCIPLTTKYIKYNIAEDDIITITDAKGQDYTVGVVVNQAKYVSKLRIFEEGIILKPDPPTIVKAKYKFSEEEFKRWTTFY